MKRFVCIVISLMILATLMTTLAFAAEPRWNNVASITPYISEPDDCYSCVIIGLKGTTKIDCTMVLYEKTWWGTYTEVSRTNEVYNGKTYEFNGYYAISAAKTYKLDITAIVTCNGVNETVSCSFEK